MSWLPSLLRPFGILTVTIRCHYWQDYTVPDFFSESDDFLTGLDDDLRLDWRWIIMAAKRSGSGWHVDPANTTGWLALIQGAKLWGMYPPSVYHIPGEFMITGSYIKRALRCFFLLLIPAQTIYSVQ